MTASGGAVVQVTMDNLDKKYPKDSPDGRLVAFSARTPGQLPQIWIMRHDDKTFRQLTTEGGSQPSWSPDGTRIVYVRENWYQNAPEDGVLWTVDVLSAQRQQLTFKNQP